MELKITFWITILSFVVLFQSCKTVPESSTSNEVDSTYSFESPLGDFTIQLPGSMGLRFISRDSTTLAFTQSTITLNMNTLEVIHLYRTTSDSISFKSYVETNIENLQEEHADFVLQDSTSLFSNNLQTFRLEYDYYMETVERKAIEYHYNGDNGYNYRFVASSNVTPKVDSILTRLGSTIESFRLSNE